MATYFTPDDGIVSLDNTAGSLTDISDYVSSLDLELDVKNGSFPVLGKRFEITAEGTSTMKGTLNFKSSVDTTGAQYIVNHWLMNSVTNKAGQKTLRIQTPDAAPGSFQIDTEIRPGTVKLVGIKAGEAIPGDYSLPFIADAPTYTVLT